MTWYPIIFIVAILAILIIVVRRYFSTIRNIEAVPIGDNESDTPIVVKPPVPSQIESPIERAEKLFSENKYFAAEKWYTDAARENPNDDKVWARLGVIAVTQKRYHDGIVAIRKSIKINPQVASRYYNLAMAYYLNSDTEKARAAIDRALELSPKRQNYLELKRKIEDGNT